MNFLLIAFCSSAVVLFLGSLSSKQLPKVEGKTSMGMPLLIPILGALVGCLAIYMSVAFFLEDIIEENLFTILLGLIMIGLMYWAAAVFIIVGLFHKVIYDKCSVEVYRFRSKHKFTWGNVVRVNSSALKGVYTIVLNNGESVRVNQVLKGVMPFLEQVELRSDLDLSRYLKMYKKSKKIKNP